MKSNKKRPYHRPFQEADSDPLQGMVNLFDVAMVFAVALMVAVVTHMHVTEMFTDKDFTMVKNPGKEEMEIIVKKGQEIKQYKSSGETGEGKGRVLTLNLDKTLVLGFFAQHGEKIAFGGIVLCFVLTVYFAMGGEKFQKTPEQLVNKAAEAGRFIDGADSMVDVTIARPKEVIAAISLSNFFI